MAPQSDSNPHPRLSLSQASGLPEEPSRGWRKKGGGGAAALAFPHPSPLCTQSPGRQAACATPAFLALPSLGSPAQARRRLAAERRLAGWSLPSCAPRHRRGGEGKGGRGLGGSWSPGGPPAGRRGWERPTPEPRTRPQPEPPLPPSPPPSLPPGARTRPPRPYSTPFPGPTPVLSLCVCALNNFILFGKRNNAPDFTRGKQQAEQNKEQM